MDCLTKKMILLLSISQMVDWRREGQYILKSDGVKSCKSVHIEQWFCVRYHKTLLLAVFVGGG